MRNGKGRPIPAEGDLGRAGGVRNKDPVGNPAVSIQGVRDAIPRGESWESVQDKTVLNLNLQQRHQRLTAESEDPASHWAPRKR